ncbi:outer membrane protein OmpA-like peptidoglycan-associated protein [Rhodovulum adriaticum]|uniref:Outer membrane protein OmpA-like peptidoglycan-associated protein n=1 Tax=Rhodovulum adriaticum TaxID=35804 RepID=A0A4R2NI80_RHOAD|nr:outer membrane protein OmpA-like peptidoglycan-associated protein [Rhodovulum adriaticum]
MISSKFFRVRRALGIGLLAVGAVALIAAEPAAAQQRVIQGERYVPTIWVDPDGCEHWVMDDGWEGYMTPHVTRQGIPVCRRGNTCGVINADQLFATDSAHITTAGRARLQDFFRTTKARAFIISGHTDSRASDEYNMALSTRRANAVAQVARQMGARISDVRGYGERMPVATNRTAAGMQQNRRVEITCLR